MFLPDSQEIQNKLFCSTKMKCNIEGEFELISNEYFVEYLTTLGIPEEKAQEVDSLKPTIKIVLHKTEVSITTILNNSSTTSLLKINQEVDEQLATLMVVKSLTVVGEDELTIHSRGPNGELGKRHFDFFADGMIMTLSTESEGTPVAKRFYKRIQKSQEESGTDSN